MNGNGSDKQRKPRRIRVASSHQTNVSRTPMTDEELAEFPLLASTDLGAAEEVYGWLEVEYGLQPYILHRFSVRLHVDSGSGLVSVAFPLTNPSGKVVDLCLMPLGSAERIRRYLPASGKGAEPKVFYWFGQHLYSRERPVVLFANPLDALKLASLGVSNVLASCLPPTDVQFSSVGSKTALLAFEENEVGKQAFKDGLRLINCRIRYVMLWADAGLKSARELDSLSRFKSVFHAKRRIAS